jgi:hypothetical protein
MLGGDDSSDDGEEEVIDEGGSSMVPVAAPVAAPPSPAAARVPATTVPVRAPLPAPTAGWTRHKSGRYKDARHASGYEYYFNPATGEARWAEEQSSDDDGNGASGARTVKRGRAEELATHPASPPSSSLSSSFSAPSLASSLWYASRPTEALSPLELERLVRLSDGHVKVIGPNHAQYYCDQQKREKWAFHTDRLGLEMLCHMVRENQPALEACQGLIEAAGAEAGRQGGAKAVLDEGRSIYTEKKHLIQGVEGHKKVTWSQEEYAHAGMQLMYLTLKSWQRFTETWALMERATRLGLLEPHRRQPPRTPTGSSGGGSSAMAGAFAGRPVRVLSIGGGPGYELLAFERFFRLYGDRTVPVQLVSLDLMPGWRPFVKAMGMQFGVYDIEGPRGLLEVADAVNAEEGKAPFPAHGITYVVISYVMIYVSTDAVCDMLAALLRSQRAYCILVSERGEETKALPMMEQRGVAVHRLIDQANGKEQR